ncbi:MAG: hypothetical protein WBI07_03815 [Mobilitalea sp.]
MKYMTPYGILNNVVQEEYYKDGTLKECLLEEENILNTEVGYLTPKYLYSDVRSKYRNSLSFYPSGKIKSIYLENATVIMTPIGAIKAELLTFYEDGSIHRLFPLYGQVSGYWSEEEEMKKIQPSREKINGIIFTAKIITYCFYPSGIVKSLTFYEDREMEVITPIGVMKIRIGISFYENGEISSVEPYKETVIDTVIGKIYAYDNAPIGVHGDENSLKFTKNGKIKSVKTIMTGLDIKSMEDKGTQILPKRRRSFMDFEKYEMVPIEIAFSEEKLEIQDSDGWVNEYLLQDNRISTVYNILYKSETGCSDCASCKECS